MFGMSLGQEILTLLVYFVPSIIAGIRKNKNTLAIFLLDLLLGWTVIGWIAALVWAVKK